MDNFPNLRGYNFIWMPVYDEPSWFLIVWKCLLSTFKKALVVLYNIAYMSGVWWWGRHSHAMWCQMDFLQILTGWRKYVLHNRDGTFVIFIFRFSFSSERKSLCKHFNPYLGHFNWQTIFMYFLFCRVHHGEWWLVTGPLWKEPEIEKRKKSKLKVLFLQRDSL